MMEQKIQQLYEFMLGQEKPDEWCIFTSYEIFKQLVDDGLLEELMAGYVYKGVRVMPSKIVVGLSLVQKNHVQQYEEIESE